jgi:hypothetical protein
VELAKRAEVILLLAAVRPYQENQEVYQRLAYTSTTKTQLLPLLRPEVSLGVRRFCLFASRTVPQNQKLLFAAIPPRIALSCSGAARQKQASATTPSVTKMVMALGQFPDGRPDPGHPQSLVNKVCLILSPEAG